jgi:hypothetical protein
MPRTTAEIIADLRAASKAFLDEARASTDSDEIYGYASHASMLSEAADRLTNAVNAYRNGVMSKIEPCGGPGSEMHYAVEALCDAIADGSIDALTSP